MCTAGKADKQHCRPDIVHGHRKRSNRQTHRANKHGCFTGFFHCPAFPYQKAGNPARRDTDEYSDNIGERDSDRDLFQIESALGVEVIRQPENVKPPDRVGEELAEHEAVSLTVAQEHTPGNLIALYGVN